MREPSAVIKIGSVYWSVGGFQVVRDNGTGGTGKWVVLKRAPDSFDNPLAFCDTLREARLFIAQAIAALKDKP